MELPQPRPFGAEGTKSTHDFLSLYTHSSPQLDPRASSSQGGYLKTHDFLQPQERITKKASAKEEMDVEIPPPPAPPPPPSSVEHLHLLPGGIGTYSISHVSYFNQRLPKPEASSSVFTGARSSSAERNDEKSNGSSFAGGSGFTLWEECAVKKGKTGKENIGGDRANEPRTSTGQWTASSSNNHYNTFSSLSSSQGIGKKNQTFMEMLKSAKSTSHDDELDDDDDFVVKKETSSSNKGDLRIKVDEKSSDQKANTPRSKHSATEQRRRSKINDRFQMLRGLIPHSDQKRDKASFLLEVVEYIQFLQEKVHKYEGSYQEWNHEMAKMMPLRNNQRPADGYVDQSRGINSVSGPALVFAAKFVEKSLSLSPNVPVSSHNQVDSDTSSATTLKAADHHSGRTNNAIPFPLSVQPKQYASARGGVIVPQLPKQQLSDLDTGPQIVSCQTRRCNGDVAVGSEVQKEQDLTIEGGTISISSAYSQGLLNTLTHALQSSGVDLSQARISVQIELGNRATSRNIGPKSIVKDVDISTNNTGTTRSRVSATEDSEKALKKLKTVKS